MYILKQYHYFIFQYVYFYGLYAIARVRLLHFFMFSESHMTYELWSVMISYVISSNKMYHLFIHFFNVLIVLALVISPPVPFGKKIPLLCCYYSAVGNVSRHNCVVSALCTEKKSMGLTLLKYLSNNHNLYGIKFQFSAWLQLGVLS